MGDMKKTLRQLINEFHLATLITSDKNLGFLKHQENIITFEKELRRYIKL